MANLIQRVVQAIRGASTPPEAMYSSARAQIQAVRDRQPPVEFIGGTNADHVSPVEDLLEATRQDVADAAAMGVIETRRGLFVRLEYWSLYELGPTVVRVRRRGSRSVKRYFVDDILSVAEAIEQLQPTKASSAPAKKTVRGKAR